MGVLSKREDPICLALRINFYGYANGDPVNLSDPFGLCPLCITAGGRWGGIRDLSLQSKSNPSALTESATAGRRSTSSVGWLAPL